MFTFIKNLFKRNIYIKSNPALYETGGYWGNAIHFDDRIEGTNTFKLHGWKHHIPEKGDVLLSQMKSGKTGKFVFTEIEKCGDPADMFFGKAEMIGYYENEKINE